MIRNPDWKSYILIMLFLATFATDCPLADKFLVLNESFNSFQCLLPEI